jgi:hypothetical protein
MWYAAADTLLVVAATLLLVFLASAAVIIVRTNQGELVIETNDNQIAVQLEKNVVKVHDRSSNREYLLNVGKHRLPSGEYEIDVKELPAGIEMSTTTFRLKRGETMRLTALARPSSLEGPDNLAQKVRPIERAEPVRRAETEKVPKSFGPNDKPLSRDDITADEGG